MTLNLQNLRAEIEDAGFNLHQVATETGIEANHLYKVFSGNRKLTADEYALILDLLGKWRGGKPAADDKLDKDLMAEISGALIAECKKHGFIPDDKDFQLLLLQTYDQVKSGNTTLADVPARADAVISMEAAKSKRSTAK